jgi:hypothetical protein
MAKSSRDYIPHREAELVPWAENFALWVSNYSEDLDIPQSEVNALKAAVTQFKNLFEEAKSSEKTPFIIAQKKAAKADMIAKIRALVRFRLQNPLVTDAMRVQFGLPPRDIIRTPHIEVAEVVEFELKLRNIREILVNFWIKGETHKAKPHGYDGAVIVWDILDTPPAEPDNLTRHTMASKTPHALEFTEEQRGKTVYIAASWQNERGNIGQWSEIQSAVVP